MSRAVHIARLSLYLLAFSLAAATFSPDAALYQIDSPRRHSNRDGARSTARNASDGDPPLRTGDRDTDNCIDHLSTGSKGTLLVMSQGEVEILEACKLQSEVLRLTNWHMHDSEFRNVVLRQNFNGILTSSVKKICRKSKKRCMMLRKTFECVVPIIKMILNRKGRQAPKKSRLLQGGSSKASNYNFLEFKSIARSSSLRVPAACRNFPQRTVQNIIRRLCGFSRSNLRVTFAIVKRQLAALRRLSPRS